MKQVNLTITFDEEKLSALKRYMSKKELDKRFHIPVNLHGKPLLISL